MPEGFVLRWYSCHFLQLHCFFDVDFWCEQIFEYNQNHLHFLEPDHSL
jgi:hypothetical protein